MAMWMHIIASCHHYWSVVRHSKLVLELPDQQYLWYNEAIDNAKRLRRKAERKWRKTKRVNDFIDYRAKRNQVTFLMNSGKRKFYAEFMDDNCGDQTKMFNAAKQQSNFLA